MSDAAALLEQIRTRTEPLKNRDRLAIPAQPMPEQPAEARRRNIHEVALGYSDAQAMVEATRCLQCKNAPCVEGCPVRIDIPGFVREVAAGNFKAAADVIRKNSLLPAVCGRVCPQETQCQLPCTVGKSLKDVGKAVAIGRLERFVADWERDNGHAPVPEVKPETGKKVAVIGSGPASLVVAADVRREGHAVTMFEAFQKPGGVMIYGIPEFRLPKRIVQHEIDTLKRMGVHLKTNFVIGRTRKLSDLMAKDGYDAVFVGSGAGLPKFMGIEGENLVGVFSANEYLTRANLMRAYDRERADTPIFRLEKGGRARRRERRDGLGADGAAARRRAGLGGLPPHREGDARARRRGPPRQGRGHRLPLPAEREAHPRRRQEPGHRAWSACATSWASPTNPGDGARWRSPAASS